MVFPLNTAQDAAANALSGRVLISAGAGSGKTRTLTERFVRSLADSPQEGWSAATPEQIVAITFTDKAAGELGERIRTALRAARRDRDAREIDRAWISTIHGFCSRVLRTHALEAGLDPAFGVADVIEAGVLKEKAFEAAAREVICSAGGEALFGAFEFDALFEAAEGIGRAIRTRALLPESLALEPVPDAADVRLGAITLFRTSAQAIGACDDSTQTAATQLARCGDAAATLEDIDFGDMSNSELGEEVWRRLNDWKPAGTTKKTAEVRERLKAEHARLRALAATCAAEPLARTMKELSVAYELKYSQLKRERGLLDFDDLQVETLTLLQRRPAIAEEYRAQFRSVMVDEFQDTDGLQAALVNAVAGANLCTVGDERQSIYRFRGADVDVYRAHNRAMGAQGARSFDLHENYRSHPDILAFVNAVFGSAVLFGGDLPALEAGREERQPPLVKRDTPRLDVCLVHHTRVAGGVTLDDARRVEAAEVARRLAALRDGDGVRPGQMAVLLRTYSQAEVYGAALREHGFATLVVGGSRFFDADEVIVLRSFLRAVANPADEEALAVTLASPLCRITDDALWLLRHAVDESAGSQGLWVAVCAADNDPRFSARDRTGLDSARELIERARGRLGRAPLSEILLRAVEESDLDLTLLSDDVRGRQAFANVLKLVRAADAFEASGGAGPAEFEGHLQSKERLKDHTGPATLADEEAPGVRLMSVHASKGLEFPVVAVVGLGEPDPGDRSIVRVAADAEGAEMALRLPSDWSETDGASRTIRFAELDEAEKSESLEERKRVFYVASTRAEEVLILSGVGNLDKRCTASDAKTPLDWLRVALGNARELDSGETSVLRVGEAAALVSRVEVADLTVPADSGSVTDDAAGLVPTTTLAADTGEADKPCTGAPALRSGGRDTLPSKHFFELPSVSYSDLELFERCERRFFAQRILRVGIPGEAPGAGPREFGSALHAVLQLTDETGGPPDSERVRAIARYNRVPEARIGELAAIAQRFSSSVLAGQLAESERVNREWPFALQMGAGTNSFLLTGAMDAYGRTGTRALVVDYKTGTSGDVSVLPDRYRLQARCYALAALRDGASDVRVIFVRPEVVDEAGEMQAVEFAFGVEDAGPITEEIVSARERILGSVFDRLPSWDEVICQGCPIAGSVCDLDVTAGRGS